MLFKQLLNGRLNSDFIIVKDSLKFSWIWIIREFIEEHLSKGNKVHFFMFENKEYDWLTKIMGKYGRSLHVHDFFSDPYNWMGTRDNQNTVSIESLSSLLTKELSNEDVQNVVVIDSLSYLLQYSSLYSVCHNLKDLRNHPKLENGHYTFLFLTVLHSELFNCDEIEYKQLVYMSTSSINLTGDLNNTEKGVMNVVHKTSRGKIMKEDYSCWLDKTGNIHYEKIVEEDLTKKNEEPNLDITTFKLTLNDEEMESRKNLVLPYLKKGQHGTGMIFYEPDARDDWDDEDPDDDLQI